MAEIESKRKQERAARIMRRAQNYIDGDISLDTFVMLEQLDNEGDDADIVAELEKERKEKEAEERRKEQNKEADKLREIYEREKAEAETKQEPKQAAPKKREPIVPDLVNMTAEEFRALSLQKQQEYYDAAPDRVREILEARPAYMDLISPKPKPRSFKGLTLEEFKKMRLPELQELYNADPALYKQLRDEREAESTK